MKLKDNLHAKEHHDDILKDLEAEFLHGEEVQDVDGKYDEQVQVHEAALKRCVRRLRDVIHLHADGYVRHQKTLK